MPATLDVAVREQPNQALDTNLGTAVLSEPTHGVPTDVPPIQHPAPVGTGSGLTPYQRWQEHATRWGLDWRSSGIPPKSSHPENAQGYAQPYRG